MASFAAVAADEKAREPLIYRGRIDVGAAVLRLEFHLLKHGDGWSGSMVSVDQGGAVVPLDRVQVDGQDVQLEINRIQFRYRGKFSEDRKSLQGTLTQFGQSFDLPMERTDAVKDLKHVATWTGTLVAGPKEFDFQLRIFENQAGQRVGKLDSFSEGLMDLALELSIEGDAFHFDLPITRARYEGTFNEERTQITGKWLQSQQSFPLDWKKITLEETRQGQPPRRPQTPQKPFPYEEREVRFENVHDQVALAGTLTLPKNSAQVPAAILVSGSGPQDRDETLLDHKPFLVLADHLTRQGFAVLRYDDRGTGESTGDFAAATLEDFTRDASAAIDYLRQLPEIDPARIGIIGHSEGGLIGPRVATQRDDVAFVVMMAGTGVPGDQIIQSQVALIRQAEGASAEDVQPDLALQEKLLALAAGDTSDEETATELMRVIDQWLAALPAARRETVAVEGIKAEFAQLRSPWARFFLRYDPRPALQQLKPPTLVMNGSRDLQVDPKLNLPAIRSAFEAGGKDNYKMVELEDLNHLFQTCNTGSPSEYRQIEETIAPAALEVISDFLRRITKEPKEATQ